MEPRSCWSLLSSGSATSSGIVSLRDTVLDALGKAVQGAGQGDIVGIVQDLFNLSNLRFEVFAGIRFLQLQLANFVMNLALKAGAGLAKFGHELSHLSGDLRQPPWPKQDKGQQHQKDDLAGATNFHNFASMILQKSGDLRSTASRDGSGDRVIGNREIGSSGHRRRG